MLKLITSNTLLSQQVLDQSKFLTLNGKRVIDSTGALNLQEVPGKLVVVGGGYIGSELGTAFANFGSDVTILEGAKEILADSKTNGSTS